MTVQPLFGGAATLGNLSNQFITPYGFQSSATAEAPGRQWLVAAAGSLSNLHVRFAAAAGASNTWVFTVMVNGVASGVTCTITGASQTAASDDTHTVSVGAGDLVSVRAAFTNGGSLVLPSYRLGLSFTGTTTAQVCAGAWITGGGPSTSVQSYVGACAPRAANTFGTSLDYSHADLNAIAGTITALYVKIQVAPGSTHSWDFYIYRNGSQEATSKVTISNAATTGNVTGLSIALAAGDTLAFSAVPHSPSSASSITWGIAITATTDGESPIYEHPSSSGASNSAARFMLAFGTGDAQSSSESTTELSLAPVAFAWKKMYVDAVAAPGGSATLTFKDRINSGDGTLAAVISASGTTGNDTSHSDSLSADDEIDLSVTPASTPTVGEYRIGTVAFVSTGAAGLLLGSEVGLMHGGFERLSGGMQ